MHWTIKEMILIRAIAFIKEEHHREKRQVDRDSSIHLMGIMKNVADGSRIYKGRQSFRVSSFLGYKRLERFWATKG